MIARNNVFRGTLIVTLILAAVLAMGCASGGFFKFSGPIKTIETALDAGSRYIALDAEIECYKAQATELDIGKIKADIHPAMYRAGGAYEELAALNEQYGIEAGQASGRTPKPAVVLAKEAELAGELEQVENRLIYFRAKYKGCRNGGDQ